MLWGVFSKRLKTGGEGGEEVHNDQFVDAAVGLSITRKIKRAGGVFNELKFWLFHFH